MRSFARRQAGCKALRAHYGIGELTSVAILAELGDTRRFSSSRHAVRFAGLDATVSQSDDKRASGKLRACADRLTTFYICRFSKRSNWLLLTHWYIRYPPIHAASKEALLVAEPEILTNH